jgi:hypothetical protein
MAEYSRVAEESGGGDVPGAEAVHALAMLAMRQLTSEEGPLPPPPDESMIPPEGPLVPPGGLGLTPVFETTERSQFSATGDWGAHNGAGSEGNASADMAAVGQGSLGADGNLASVKKGFFDASKLDMSIEDEEDEEDHEEDHDGDDLQSRFERMEIKYKQQKAQCAQLREALRQSQAAEEELKELNKQNVRQMLQVNESLQQQLRDLNGVVERVVLKQLSGGSGHASGHASPAAATPAPRLPASAFPAQAKPGSRLQRQPRPRQQPPGAKPFK